ncbi:hypothetical protein U1Q18_000651 [Sarracenia purpurea var. burkii]
MLKVSSAVLLGKSSYAQGEPRRSAWDNLRRLVEHLLRPREADRPYLKLCSDQRNTLLNVQISIKPLDASISPPIAPLDADPSLPPYDSKTNYLSPKPQFLHYRPNPRIEVYLHKEEGKWLKHYFLTESLSDTEVSKKIESRDLNKESEDDSSAEIINEEEEEPHDFEPKLIKTDEEKKTMLKPQFFPESKSIALLLVLLIARLLVSVIDSPSFDLSAYNEINISKFINRSVMVEFTKASYDGIARNLKKLSKNSAIAKKDHKKSTRKMTSLNRWKARLKYTI